MYLETDKQWTESPSNDGMGWMCFAQERKCNKPVHSCSMSRSRKGTLHTKLWITWKQNTLMQSSLLFRVADHLGPFGATCGPCCLLWVLNYTKFYCIVHSRFSTQNEQFLAQIFALRCINTMVGPNTPSLGTLGTFYFKKQSVPSFSSKFYLWIHI